MQTIAAMMDRLLTPDDGGSSEAGKAGIRPLAALSKQQFEPMKPRNEK